MILDFKEIPQANGNSGLQDSFELFARDFLSYLGFIIIEDPDRGADGKRDLIAEEIIHGILKDERKRWLVSCKHYAFSGKAVKDTDEPDIRDRLDHYGCSGFLGIYSTLAATSLSGKLNCKSSKYEAVIFDHEKIERLLLKDIDGLKLAARYFPISFKNYRIENPIPANIYDKLEPIECEICHKNLLLQSSNGIMVHYGQMREYDENGDIIPGLEKNIIKKVSFCCKGEHDKILQEKYSYQLKYYYLGWKDLKDLTNPTIWISNIMAFINQLYSGDDIYTKEAFETMKKFYCASYPYVARQLTTQEKQRVGTLLNWNLI